MLVPPPPATGLGQGYFSSPVLLLRGRALSTVPGTSWVPKTHAILTASLGSGETQDLPVLLSSLHLQVGAQPPRGRGEFPLTQALMLALLSPLPRLATVKVQRSEHRWDPCVPSCHSPRPGHCRTSTWATSASQDQSRCNMPTPLWLVHVSEGRKTRPREIRRPAQRHRAH